MTVTHKPTFFVVVVVDLEIGMLKDRFSFTEVHNLYRAKENILSSAALGFATLGKRLQLFLPSNFPAFLL